MQKETLFPLIRSNLHICEIQSGLCQFIFLFHTDIHYSESHP